MSDGRKEKLGEEKRAGCVVLPKVQEKPRGFTGLRLSEFAQISEFFQF